MDLTAPIATVDPKRQVAIIDRDGLVHPQTDGGSVPWASWGALQPTDVHSWPTWSSDGRRLALFRIDRSGAGNRVLVTDVGGVGSAEVCELGARLPIYLQWAPDDQRLAVLSQSSDQLVLDVVDTGSVGGARELLRGSPLFFTWLEDQRIAAFVGEPDGPHLAVIEPVGGERRNLPGQPGNFCAPVALDGAVAYVAHLGDRVTLLMASPDDDEVHEVDEVEGLAAIVASPDRRTLAMAVAPDGSGVAYRDLSLIDVASGLRQPVGEVDGVAFFWTPTGDALVVARKEEQRGTVGWYRVGLDGHTELLFEVRPTRDLRFYLRFFEQYCHSHPILDPTGTTLLVAGRLRGESEAEHGARVFAVPLDGSPAEELCEGLFAVYGPPGA